MFCCRLRCVASNLIVALLARAQNGRAVCWITPKRSCSCGEISAGVVSSLQAHRKRQRKASETFVGRSILCRAVAWQMTEVSKAVESGYTSDTNGSEVDNGGHEVDILVEVVGGYTYLTVGQRWVLCEALVPYDAV